jgi:hypothetical protein
VTNNRGHSRTKSEVSPKITYYGRLHVIAYRATLDVPREVVWFLAKLLAAERQRRGTPRGSRALTCFWQAVPGLRWFRDRTAADALARDHRISRATAYRYLDEVVTVLAEQAPDLREALEHAKDKGFSHLILDGKIRRDPGQRRDLLVHREQAGRHPSHPGRAGRAGRVKG